MSPAPRGSGPSRSLALGLVAAVSAQGVLVDAQPMALAGIVGLAVACVAAAAVGPTLRAAAATAAFGGLGMALGGLGTDAPACHLTAAGLGPALASAPGVGMSLGCLVGCALACVPRTWTAAIHHAVGFGGMWIGMLAAPSVLPPTLHPSLAHLGATLLMSAGAAVSLGAVCVLDRPVLRHDPA